MASREAGVPSEAKAFLQIPQDSARDVPRPGYRVAQLAPAGSATETNATCKMVCMSGLRYHAHGKIYPGKCGKCLIIS